MINIIGYGLLLQAWEVDLPSLQQVILIAVAIITALWLWRSGLPQQLFSSANSLVELRTKERDDALKDVQRLKTENEKLDDENTLLRRECSQRMEIWWQDQATIRDLRDKMRG